MKRFLISLIRLYQTVISPMLPQGRCRFYPSCSAYAVEAIEEHGAVKGSWMSVSRVFRCHPLHPGGYDPVPRNSTFR